MNLIEELEELQRLSCGDFLRGPPIALGRPGLEVRDSLRVVIEPDDERRSVGARGVSLLREIGGLRGIVPVGQQPLAEARRWRRTSDGARSANAQQAIVRAIGHFAAPWPRDLHARVIRRIGEPQHPRMLTQRSDRRKTKLIGFLEKEIELPNLLPDVIIHPGLLPAAAPPQLASSDMESEAYGLRSLTPVGDAG